MSTLKTANIQDTSGSNNSTPEQINQGRAKAWVTFNGSGTVAILDSYNVSSITDVAVGVYEVNFTNAMSNNNYAYSINRDRTGAENGGQVMRSVSTSLIGVGTFRENFASMDPNNVSVIIFGV